MIVNTQRNVRLFVVNVSIATCEIVADRMNDNARPLVRFLDNDIQTFGEASERFAFGYGQIEVDRRIGIARSNPNTFSINLSRRLFPDDKFEPFRISTRYGTRIERAKRSNSFRRRCLRGIGSVGSKVSPLARKRISSLLRGTSPTVIIIFRAHVEARLSLAFAIV